MSAGKIAQLGTPREIYNLPETPGVAEFIGTTSFLEGTTLAPAQSGGVVKVRLAGGQVIAVPVRQDWPGGRPVRIALRPERLDLLQDDAPDMAPGARLPVDIEAATYLGSTIQYDVRLDAATSVKVETQRDIDGGHALLWIPPHACSLFASDARAA